MGLGQFANLRGAWQERGDGQIAHLLQKRFLAKLTVIIVCPLYSFMLQHLKKSPQRANNKTESCIIFAQTGCELLSQTRIFRKVDHYCFDLAFAFHHAIPYQNICHRVDREYKVAQFLP